MTENAKPPPPHQELPASSHRLIERPALYVALLALYAASFHDALLPPVGQGGADTPDAKAIHSHRTLEDMLRWPRETSFAAAAAVLVPLCLGTGLLIGYCILRAHGIIVFPRCDFPIPRWTGWHLLRAGIVLAVLLRGAAIGAAWLPHLRRVGAVGEWLPTGLTLALGANLTMLLLCLFIVALVGRREGNPLRLLGLAEARPLSRAAMGVAGFLMVHPLLVGVGTVMFILAPQVGVEPRPQEVLVQVVALSPGAFAMAVASVALLTPVTEEIVFRGFFYATLRRAMGPLSAIILSALVFALLHAYAFGLPSLFLIGFLLAYLYERTGSLVASILAHATHNFYTLLAAYLAFHDAVI